MTAGTDVDPYCPAVNWSGGTLPEPPIGLLALWLAAWGQQDRPLLYLPRGEGRARALCVALRALLPGGQVLVFPPWDCLPYDRAPPSAAAMGERMAVLRRLLEPCPAPGRIVVASVAAAAQRLPPPSALADATLRVAVGARLEPEELQRFLVRVGYVVDERVDEPGEAAVRGNVVDLFPAEAKDPLRIELAGERVVSLRTYDALSQRSLEDVTEAIIGPASEIVLPGDAAAPSDGATRIGCPWPTAGSPRCWISCPRAPRHRGRDGPDPRRSDGAGGEAFETRPRLVGSGGEPSSSTPIDPKLLYIPEAEWRVLLESHAHVRLTMDGEGAGRRCRRSDPSAIPGRQRCRLCTSGWLPATASSVAAATPLRSAACDS